MNTPSRRDFLRLTGAAAIATGISGCGKSDTASNKNKPFSGQTLRVFVYSGAWEKGFRESFVPAFEEMTGATVVTDPGWWDSIPKLKASPPDQPAFDLVLTDATQGQPAIKEGMFQTLDMGKIPNAKRLPPAVLDNKIVRENYGITFPESAMTLAYNKTMVKSPLENWGDLMRDDLKGQLGIYNSFYMSLYTFSCMKVAMEGRIGQAATEVNNNLQGVINFAKENRDRVKLWWPTSTDMALNLTRKNCAAGNMHSSDMLIALRDSKDLAATVPTGDTAFVQLMWVIPTGTKVRELAHEAINFLLSDQVQEGFTKVGSGSAILPVAEKMAKADPIWGGIYPSTAEALSKVAYYPYETYLDHWDDISQVWDREILRKG